MPQAALLPRISAHLQPPHALALQHAALVEQHPGELLAAELGRVAHATGDAVEPRLELLAREAQRAPSVLARAPVLDRRGGERAQRAAPASIGPRRLRREQLAGLRRRDGVLGRGFEPPAHLEVMARRAQCLHADLDRILPQEDRFANARRRLAGYDLVDGI